MIKLQYSTLNIRKITITVLISNNMVCNYRRKVNKNRTYGCCNNEDLQTAINALESRRITLQKASEVFNVKNSTLHDHVEGAHNKKPVIFFLYSFQRQRSSKKFSSLDIDNNYVLGTC